MSDGHDPGINNFSSSILFNNVVCGGKLMMYSRKSNVKWWKGLAYDVALFIAILCVLGIAL